MIAPLKLAIKSFQSTVRPGTNPCKYSKTQLNRKEHTPANTHLFLGRSNPKFIVSTTYAIKCPTLSLIFISTPPEGDFRLKYTIPETTRIKLILIQFIPKFFPFFNRWNPFS